MCKSSYRQRLGNESRSLQHILLFTRNNSKAVYRYRSMIPQLKGVTGNTAASESAMKFYMHYKQLFKHFFKWKKNHLPFTLGDQWCRSLLMWWVTPETHIVCTVCKHFQLLFVIFEWAVSSYLLFLYAPAVNCAWQKTTALSRHSAMPDYPCTQFRAVTTPDWMSEVVQRGSHYTSGTYTQ